jgi:hypothetical protein
MGWRFFRRVPIIGNLVTLNVSKGGVSVSAGVPGARVTTGMHGTQATVGLPGTGLFYTHHFQDSVIASKQPAVGDYFAGLRTCLQAVPVNPADVAAALNRQRTLGLTDADFNAEGQAALTAVHEWLRDAHGYRIMVPVRSSVAPVPAPSRPSALLPLLLIGAVLLLAAALAFLARG